MFEFLFKRPGDKPSDQQASPEQAAAAVAATAQAEQAASRRAAQAEQAKALAEDEAAAVELILHSEFADVRLAAAAHVTSQPALEKVQQAMRNTDRRVAKLVQSRLDALRHQQAEQRQAVATIATARKLLQEEKLTPNQVAELDRMWKVIASTVELAEEFQGVRSALGKRLEDQVDLQRAALDALAAVRRIGAGQLPAKSAPAPAATTTPVTDAASAPEPESASVPAPDSASAPILDAASELAADATSAPAPDASAAPADVASPPTGPAPSFAATLLDELAVEHAKHVAAAESGALPRNLLSDFETAMTEARANVAAVDARRAALSAWQATNSLGADELKRAWQALPRLPENELARGLQQEFDILLARAPAPAAPDSARKPARADSPPSAAGAARNTPQHGHAAAEGSPAEGAAHADARHPPGKQRDNSAAAQEASRIANQRFIATLDAMEAALAEGQLHIANDHDKTLKEAKTGRLTPAQAERLAHVRGELKRLGDWARWGGNVSREELVKAVEDLHGQQLAMAELAKKVGSMRERWKALDSVSGPAPKGLWERFDAACTTAYAPAAAHFKHLADERHTNAAKAQAMIAEVEALAAKSASAETPDYKGLAAASQRLRQAWSRLGAIDRKEKKKLDTAFGKAMDVLLAPLENQRAIEVACREQLIEETGKLNPGERHTLETLRMLQERWQEHAKALPLERKQEQALWQRFRGACDAIFAARKESAHAADSERRAHLHAREAICAQLEQATFSGDDKAQQAAIAKALRDAASAWHASGSVPRASEQKIEQRYKAAVATVQGQADAIRKRAGAAQANALRDKLRLVQALETALTEPGDIDGADWDSRWHALPALAADYERTLRARFSAALAAAADPAKRGADAARLEAARAGLLDEVLRLEIVAGVDSGAEFARDRLKMQVEVLQSSLKSGQRPMTQAAQFLQLCAMPALADARTASRIEQLFRRIGAEAK
jgi:hypothetical protein